MVRSFICFCIENTQPKLQQLLFTVSCNNSRLFYAQSVVQLSLKLCGVKFMLLNCLVGFAGIEFSTVKYLYLCVCIGVFLFNP